MPLMVSFLGYAHSGKSYSALEFATGVSRATGDEIWAIGTEGNALKMYQDRFRFRHIRLDAPYGSLDYLAAIEHCVSKGAKLIVIDNMSYEHTGAGGCIDLFERTINERVERALQRKSETRPRWKLELAFNMVGWKAAKDPRTKLERRMEELRNSGVVFVLTFRADEKYVPTKGGQQQQEGDDDRTNQWKVESTSELPYQSVLRWLLTPGCDGKATFVARNPSESKLVKTPEPLRQWCREGTQITAALGEQIARWAMAGGDQKPAQRRQSTALKFHKSYASNDVPTSRAVAESDPPTLHAYLGWLDQQPQSEDRDRHMAAVQNVYNTMLNAGEAAQ